MGNISHRRRARTNKDGRLRSERQSSGTAKVPIIDDDASIRRWRRLVLEEEGHEIPEARDGRDGLAASQRTPADLVLANIQVPEMHGLDLTLELTCGLLDTKVIAISSEADAHAPS